MKRVYSLLLVFIGICIGFLCGTFITIAYSDLEKTDYERPVAKVGETAITRGQLAEAAIRLSGKRLIIGDLQAQALVTEAARRAGVTVTADEVNKQVDELLSYARDAMAPVTYKEIPRSVWADNARMILLAQKMMGVTITEKEARDYYMKRPGGFVVPAMAKLICIAVPSRTDANKVLKRLNDGENPRELAASFNADPALKRVKGDIGWVTRQRLGPEVDVAIFDANDGAGLKPKQYTDVIKVEYFDPEKYNAQGTDTDNISVKGIMTQMNVIFYVEDIQPAYTPKFEEIKDAAFYAARMTKYQEQAPAWLARLAADIGKEWQTVPSLFDPNSPLKSAPLDPKQYDKNAGVNPNQ